MVPFLSGTTSLCDSSPPSPIDQISSPLPPTKAIFEPSGEAEAAPAPSRSLRKVPPAREKSQIPVSFLGPAPPLISSLVPSRNHVRQAHRKQRLEGAGNNRV